MQKWEYFRLIISLDGDKWLIKYKGQKVSYDQIQAVLNELGEQGWELATSTAFNTWNTKAGFASPSGYISYTDTYIYTFKRPKS
jgi:hypothetical protein